MKISPEQIERALSLSAKPGAVVCSHEACIADVGEAFIVRFVGHLHGEATTHHTGVQATDEDVFSVDVALSPLAFDSLVVLAIEAHMARSDVRPRRRRWFR